MPLPKLRVNRFNTREHLHQLMLEITQAPASQRPRLWAIIEQLNGIAEDYLKECGSAEELACGYGIGARQHRRWMRAYNEGGIAGLLERRHGKRGRKRKMGSAQFYDQVLSAVDQHLAKPSSELTAKEAYQWAREHLKIPFSYPTFMRYLGRRSSRFSKRRQAHHRLRNGSLAGHDLGLAWLKELVHAVRSESGQEVLAQER